MAASFASFALIGSGIFIYGFGVFCLSLAENCSYRMLPYMPQFGGAIFFLLTLNSVGAPKTLLCHLASSLATALWSPPSFGFAGTWVPRTSDLAKVPYSLCFFWLTGAPYSGMSKIPDVLYDFCLAAGVCWGYAFSGSAVKENVVLDEFVTLIAFFYKSFPSVSWPMRLFPASWFILALAYDILLNYLRIFFWLILFWNKNIIIYNL